MGAQIRKMAVYGEYWDENPAKLNEKWKKEKNYKVSMVFSSSWFI